MIKSHATIISLIFSLMPIGVELLHKCSFAGQAPPAIKELIPAGSDVLIVVLYFKWHNVNRMDVIQYCVGFMGG